MNINYYNPYVRQEFELYHHGVAGQKWGKRNGPPYPLSASAHSASEKKAGWRKSLSRHSNNSTKYGSNLSAHASINDERVRRQQSNKSSAGIFLARMALDVVGLNPIGLVYDTKRLIDYGRSKANVALEKERIKALKIDEKTGFHLKDREFTEKEDMKAVNPGYKNFDSNTKHNCMICSTTYELRRRGYDVQAGTATRGYKDSDVSKWFPNAKIEHSYGLPTDSKARTKAVLKEAFLGGFTGKQKYKKLSDSLLKYGDGARGNLMVCWTQGGGHSVVWENSNGKIVIRDCQSNKVYSSPRQIEMLLSKTISANFARTDNVDFDLDYIKELVK